MCHSGYIYIVQLLSLPSSLSIGPDPVWQGTLEARLDVQGNVIHVPVINYSQASE